VLTHTLEEYDTAARDDLLTGRHSLVLGQYARRTSDIRSELARLADTKRLLSDALMRRETELIEAHKARKSAKRYHQQLARTLGAPRPLPIGPQAHWLGDVDADLRAFDLEVPDAQ